MGRPGAGEKAESESCDGGEASEASVQAVRHVYLERPICFGLSVAMASTQCAVAAFEPECESFRAGRWSS